VSDTEQKYEEELRAALSELIPSLTLKQRLVPAGTLLLGEGTTSDEFLYLASGNAEVVRSGRLIGTARPGSIVGELAVLSGKPRTASVTTTTPALVHFGNTDDFRFLLEDDRIAHGVCRLVAMRMAAIAEPVRVQLAERSIWLRPGLQSDRAYLEAGLKMMSRESLVRRFFSSGRPPESVINFLLDVDYLNHFAWVAFDTLGPDAVAVGSARFIRSEDHPNHADIAFGLIDNYQRQGIGRVLCDAIAVAGQIVGIEVFTADVLRENVAMRKILSTPATIWSTYDAGIVHAVLPVDEIPQRLTIFERDKLQNLASQIMQCAESAFL
jgi:protein lysine acetyltransferase